MALEGCYTCIKYLMFAFNFLFWVSQLCYVCQCFAACYYYNNSPIYTGVSSSPSSPFNHHKSGVADCGAVKCVETGEF